MLDSKASYLQSIRQNDDLHGYMKELNDKVEQVIQAAIQNHMTECVLKEYYYKKIKDEQKVCTKHIIRLLKSKGYSVKFKEDCELVPGQDNVVWYRLQYTNYFTLRINFEPNIFSKIMLFITHRLNTILDKAIRRVLNNE